MRRTPTTVITGFLGAGKTSMIQHVLANNQGKRIALIVNEFGSLGVDRGLVLGCGLESCGEGDVVELANGCICCTVADEFLPTLTSLLDRSPAPDHIMIETSGLAMPKPLVKAFAWPAVKSRATVDGVIAVIDADATKCGLFASDPAAVDALRKADISLDHESPLHELFEEQIGCADLIVVNKADLVRSEDRPRVEAIVRRHARPGTGLVWSKQGMVDPGVIMGLGLAAEDDLDSRPSHHDGLDHDHDDFVSFTVRLPQSLPEQLKEAVAEAAVSFGVLRVKGHLIQADKPLRYVLQAVGPRVEGYYDRPRQGEAGGAELVVIGMKGLDEVALNLFFNKLHAIA